jgi:hypothetical protein
MNLLHLEWDMGDLTLNFQWFPLRMLLASGELAQASKAMRNYYDVQAFYQGGHTQTQLNSQPGDQGK